MSKFAVTFLISLIVLLNYNLFSQPIEVCGQKIKQELSINKKTSLSYGISSPQGIYLPTKGTIRALAIFVQFKDDYDNDNDWKLNEIPNYAEDLSKDLTSYFSDMSGGQLNFIVDVFPKVVITDRTQSQYTSEKLNYGQINKDVLAKVDEDISFLPYDNWIQEDKYKLSPGQDNQIDLVFMIYRRVSVYGLLNSWGVSDLGFGWKCHVDNTKRFLYGGNSKDHNDASGSGLTICKSPGSGMVMDKNSAFRLLIHETQHKLYGEGHIIYNFAALGVLSNAYGSVGMNSFEKSTFGYLTYKMIDTLDNAVLTLRDYMTTGDAYLIPVPDLPNQYYILENRQKISVYDEAQYPGLYIYHLQYANEYSKIDIQSADGKWDWTLDDNKNVIKLKPNPISGSSHLEIVPINGGLYYPPEMQGNASDPFTLGQKTLYAPWTNPTSNGKYSAYQDYPTNVYMNLLDNTNGVMKIRLSFSADVVKTEELLQPDGYKLCQNYPNPFNSSTKISYSISKSSFVTIKLFDLLGREVKTLVNEQKNLGSYLLDLNTTGLAGGVYYVRMKAGDFSDMKKIVYLK